MSLKSMFELTKEKVVADIVFSSLLVFIFLSIPSLGFQQKFLAAGLIPKAISIFASMMFSMIVYYPFVCSILIIYKKIFKSEKTKKADLIIALLLILIWNPITPGIIYSKMISGSEHPCGIEIGGFAPNSPAKDAGISAKEVIIGADRAKIDTLDSFKQAMAGKKPGDTIIITTQSKDYNVKLVEDPQTNLAVLGIMIKQNYCRR